VGAVTDPYRDNPYYRPPEQSSTKWVAYLVGALVIGPVLAIGMPVLTLSIYGASSVDDEGAAFAGVLVLGILLPFLLPVPLLFRRGSRPWGVGILIGVAVTVIVLGGLCAGFIYLLSQETT
jgi:hypothetical protein